jgi:3-oxoacyl-[acyl-carrier protein] reductase
MVDLTGKTALVTGSGSGIGRGIALKLAEVGASVAVNGLAEEPCRETAELIAAEGGTATVIVGDVADEQAVAEIFAKGEEQVGGFDILVNNAGIQRVSWFDQMSEADWSDVIRVNLTAPFLTMRELVPQMRRRGYGRVINVGSEGALVPAIGNTNYVAAKAGLMGLTMNAAEEMAVWARKDGGDYTCNCVHPGFNLTEMSGAHSEAELERILKLVPLRRPGNPREDMGSVVAFLASEHASYVTGAKFSAGGGISMCIAS